MREAAIVVLPIVVGLVAYYVHLHLAWRKEVRLRRADRERERELMRGLAFRCSVDERGGAE